MEEFFKGLPAELMRLINIASIPRLDSKARDGCLDVSIIDETVGNLVKQKILPDWSIKQMRCLLSLWHDKLEIAHQLCQNESDIEYCYFHAMMHRREYDFYNARYWFRRVDPTFDTCYRIAEAVSKYLDRRNETRLRNLLIEEDRWNAIIFNEECRKASKLPETDPVISVLMGVQAIEFACWFKFLSQH